MSSKKGEMIEVGENQENLEEICNILLNIDQKIRFVEVAFLDKTFSKLRPGVTSNLTPKEIEESIDDALERWDTRKKFAHKLGKPVYALAEYEKVKRITFPVNHDGIILVTVNSTDFNEELIREIIEVLGRVNWNH